MIASPDFQRLATSFPLLRPIARRRARALFDLVAGFAYSQILAACIELDLLARLMAAPMTAPDLAVACDLPVEAADRLLRAAAALDLAERLGDGRYALGEAGAAVLGNPGVVAMVEHHRHLYADLIDPVALLRRGGGGGALQRFWSYAREGGGEDVAAYSRLMAASQPLVAGQIIAAYRFGRHRRMLDVGGGEGGFAAAVADAAPRLAVGLFDLPEVVARVTHPGLALHSGDFRRDPLPAGHDLVTLIRVLHDHDDTAALALLRAIRTALPPGGRLLIAEPMAETPGAAPAGDAYFGLYLWAMGSGRPRAPQAIGALLRTAGFPRWAVRRTPMPITVRMIVAQV